MRSHNHTANGQQAVSGRRARAIARAAKRSLLSTTEQIQVLDSRPGNSARERERLVGTVRETKVSRQKRDKRKAAAA